ELPGLLPTPPWRNQLYKEGKTDRPWSLGDNVNLATGQGDLEADPLQMAVAYSAIANGGNIVRPHVGMEVTQGNGQIVQEINPAPQRHVDIKPQYRSVILEGIHEAAQSPGGTSYPVFGNYPVQVAGKTGTAVRYPYGYPGQEVDQSWYVLLAPYPNPKVVIAVTIERGGFGLPAPAPPPRARTHPTSHPPPRRPKPPRPPPRPRANPGGWDPPAEGTRPPPPPIRPLARAPEPVRANRAAFARPAAGAGGARSRRRRPL